MKYSICFAFVAILKTAAVDRLDRMRIFVWKVSLVGLGAVFC